MKRRSKATIGPAEARRRKAQKPKPKDRNTPTVRRRGSAGAGLQTELAQLRRDLHDAQEQQIATADVLKAISRSNFDLQSVLDSMVESATRLCAADDAWLFQREGEFFHWVASFGHVTDVHARIREYFRSRPVPVDRGSVTGRVALETSVVHVTDVLADPEYTWSGAQQIGSYRAALGVPLLRKGNVVGVIFIAKIVPEPFTAKQIELVTTFADQAVIAIENTRLLNELRQRTDDLTESLEQQTATAEILRVISSSPTDEQPVLDSVAESAARLCEATDGIVYRIDGDLVHLVSHHGNIPHASASKTFKITRGTLVGQAVLDREVKHVADVQENYARGELREGRAMQSVAQYRTVLVVPLVRENVALGTILIRRLEVRPFSEKQVELVRILADQAVIAIENVRLFEALRARTDELARSVGELRALGEVGQAVNSTLDVETVLRTIVAKAVGLSATDAGAIYVFDDDRQEFRLRATYGMSEAMIAAITSRHIGVDDARLGEVSRWRQPVQTADVREAPASPLNDIILDAGYRALLVVPLLAPDRIVGLLVVRRRRARSRRLRSACCRASPTNRRLPSKTPAYSRRSPKRAASLRSPASTNRSLSPT